MAELLEITFAELGLLLRAFPDSADLVRSVLRLSDEVDSEVVVGAGLSSLLARGLLARDESGEMRPGESLELLVAGLSRVESAVSALGCWTDMVSVAHVFTGPNFRLALTAHGQGRYGAELLDAAEPAAAVLLRFTDACIEGGRCPTLLFRAAGDGAAMSVAVQPDGAWLISDTGADPDRSVRVDADAARHRITELFGVRPAVTLP